MLCSPEGIQPCKHFYTHTQEASNFTLSQIWFYYSEYTKIHWRSWFPTMMQAIWTNATFQAFCCIQFYMICKLLCQDYWHFLLSKQTVQMSSIYHTEHNVSCLGRTLLSFPLSKCIESPQSSSICQSIYLRHHPTTSAVKVSQPGEQWHACSHGEGHNTP